MAVSPRSNHPPSGLWTLLKMLRNWQLEDEMLAELSELSDSMRGPRLNQSNEARWSGWFVSPNQSPIQTQTNNNIQEEMKSSTINSYPNCQIPSEKPGTLMATSVPSCWIPLKTPPKDPTPGLESPSRWDDGMMGWWDDPTSALLHKTPRLQSHQLRGLYTISYTATLIFFWISWNYSPMNDIISIWNIPR